MTTGREGPAWDSSLRAFGEAAAWFVSTTGRVEGRWDRPGLGAWDVRSLVGHTSRALLTVETYLARPARTVDVASTVDYFRPTGPISASADVEARGRAAGEALGPDPAAAVEEIAARVVPLVGGCAGDELITTIAGGMRLRDYLPTRTFELVVHTADLATALGLPPEPPALPAAYALELVARLAAAGGRAGPLLLAATGRDGLPAGFSVI